MWEIIDADGVIHSGTEDEMQIAFEFMTKDLPFLKAQYPKMTMREIRNKCHEVDYPWRGELKLIQIHAIHK